MSHIQNLWSGKNQIDPDLAAQCCGCSSCAEKCPADAIEMRYDSEGFLYPLVDSKACIDCGICEKTCPLLDEKIPGKPYLETYAGYTNNRTMLLQCTSGGFATELSLAYIKKGGVVAGVQYSEDGIRAEYAIACTEEEAARFSGSKYVQSEKHDIYRQVRDALKTGTEVLFVGCPCDVHALTRYLGKEYNKLCTVELVCMGVSTYKLAEEYKSIVERKQQSKLISINARSKARGWFVPTLEEVYENGTVRHNTLYGTYLGYGMQVFNRPSCFDCKFRGTSGSGDIRIGDFWGIHDTDSYWNADGVCCIFARTEKGREKIQMLKETGFCLYPADYEAATRGNMSSYKNKSEKYILLRKKFSSVYQEKGLVAACKATGTVSFWCRLLIPDRYHQRIKKLYHWLLELRK